MIPRGLKTLVVLSTLFFVFVIGFFLVEQRQSVLMTRREIARLSQMVTLTQTRLQEVMMQRSKVTLPARIPSLKVAPVGYRDVYRVELPPSEAVLPQTPSSSGIWQLCLDWIRSQFSFARMDI